MISPAEVSSLQTTVGDYYTIAHNVSKRLMIGETGEGLVNAMGDMKSKHEQTSGLLKSAIVFDQAKLAAAFVAISNSQSTAGKLQLLISLLCLVFVTGLSFWIRQGVLRSLESLTLGLAHFSRGDFDQAIPVVSRDELGHVAIQANHMAKQIQTLVDKLAVSNQDLKHLVIRSLMIYGLHYGLPWDSAIFWWRIIQRHFLRGPGAPQPCGGGQQEDGAAHRWPAKSLPDH